MSRCAQMISYNSERPRHISPVCPSIYGWCALSWLLKVSTEPAFAAWAGSLFHSDMVRNIGENFSSCSLSPRNFCPWLYLILVSVLCNPRSSGVTVTSPLTIFFKWVSINLVLPVLNKTSWSTLFRRSLRSV